MTTEADEAAPARPAGMSAAAVMEDNPKVEEIFDANMETSTAGPSDESAKLLDESGRSPQRDELEQSHEKEPIALNPVQDVQATLAPTGSSSRRVSKRIKIRRNSRPTPKIFNDNVSVIIPLDVTADLKVAIQRTRTKRLQSIYKRFPALKKAVKKWKNQHASQEDDNSSKADDALDEDDEAAKDPNAETKGDGKENNKPSKKKKKFLADVPQPERYGSVLDYLEAKYVRGVMLGDEEADGESIEDGSEGHGSVYSQESFLDDTDLRRDVAEQVMANTTLTKLELEDDDGDFFVNVGALEVEANQYGEDYDPLQDEEASKPTKKRKKLQSTVAADASKSSTKKKKNGKETEQDVLAESAKSKKSVTSTGTVKKKPVQKVKTGETTENQSKGEEEEQSEEQKQGIAAAKKAKTKSDTLFEKLAALVKKMTAEDLPRRKTKAKVSLTCPPNKNPGDDVTFTNPHNKGQRLRVKIPKDCLPGGVFKVSVPVKHDPEEDVDDKDHNTFSREIQELVDDYARAYDNWCSAQSDVDKRFALFKEKQAKFDPLIKLFPKNLVTPVTVEYMKKIVRRARQNRHKRLKTASLKTEGTEDDEDGAEESGKEDVEEEKDGSEPDPKNRIVQIPTMGSAFPTIRWNEDDFTSS